jgi:hypothetical protein
MLELMSRYWCVPWPAWHRHRCRRDHACLAEYQRGGARVADRRLGNSDGVLEIVTAIQLSRELINELLAGVSGCPTLRDRDRP